MKLTPTFNPQNLSVSVSAPSVGADTGTPVVKEFVDIPAYEGEYSVTPTESVQMLETNGKRMADDVTIAAIPDNYVGNAVPIIGAMSYTPNKTAPLIIRAGRYLAGDQTIGMIPERYYDMSGEFSWLGADAQLVKTFNAVTTKLSETDFASWPPSTTAKDILATADVGTFTTEDFGEYEYYILWECKIPIVYTGSPTNKAKPLWCVSSQVQTIYKRPSSWANIESDVFNGAVCSSLATGTFMRYYGSTANTLTYTWGTSYGFYFTLTTASFSSTTAANPTVTVKSPKVTARCSTTYMSTANAGLIDKDETKITIQAKVYRARANSTFHGNYANVMRLIDAL